MSTVAAAAGAQSPAAAPAPKSAPALQSNAQAQDAKKQRAQAAAPAAAPAAPSPPPGSGSLPRSVVLGGAAGCAGLGLGLAGLLLLLRSWRRGKRASGKGASAAGPGPCAKLKPTSKCVPLADGSASVIRREIAADNSCLFNSVGYAMHKSRTRAPHLRTVVAQQVSSDRTTYSDAFLGMTNEAYCNWIRQPYNWGGGIELSILAQAYGIEIAAWNIESCKEHVFGEESGYKRQVMVIYNGVHYDALAVCSGPRAHPEDDETAYNPRTKRGKMIIAAARKLVELAHKESQFHGAAVKKQQQQQTAAAAAAASAPSKTPSKAPAETPSMNGTAAAAADAADGPSTSGGAATPARKVAAGGSSGRATRRVARGAAATKLSCGDCGEVLVGAAAAQQHALATGHQSYSEVA